MKKVIIWLLISATLLLGHISYYVIAIGKFTPPNLFALVFGFLSSLLIFYPTLKFWEEYFKNMFGYEK